VGFGGDGVGGWKERGGEEVEGVGSEGVVVMLNEIRTER
jgi:hypothetical protein